MSMDPEFPCDHVSHVQLGVLSIKDAVKLLQLTSCQSFQRNLSESSRSSSCGKISTDFLVPDDPEVLEALVAFVFTSTA